MFFRVSFVLISLLLSCNKSTINKPNILLIMSDDQGYHDVSYYGTSDIKTPNIDLIKKME